VIDLFWNPTTYDEAITEAAKYFKQESRTQKQIDFVINRICKSLKLENDDKISFDIFSKIGEEEGFRSG
jgi:hypothetical protein